MKMPIKKLAMLSVLLTFAFACKESSKSKSKAPPKSQYLSGNCGQNVINDYNQALRSDNSVDTQTAEHYQALAENFETFSEKYSGINCIATQLGRRIIINQSYINRIINQYRTAESLFNSYSGRQEEIRYCSQEFRTSLINIESQIYVMRNENTEAMANGERTSHLNHRIENINRLITNLTELRNGEANSGCTIRTTTGNSRRVDRLALNYQIIVLQRLKIESQNQLNNDENQERAMLSEETDIDSILAIGDLDIPEDEQDENEEQMI